MLLFAVRGNDVRRRYHFDPNCPQLRESKRTADVIAVYDDHVAYLGMKPCQNCFGDVSPDFRKPYCQLCGTYRACPHNGGVLVNTDTGDRWVWPDRAVVHRPLRNARDPV